MSDELVCESFEGDPPRYDFSQHEWDTIILANKPVLIETFDFNTRKLLVTRLFRYPIAEMKKRIENVSKGIDNFQDLRYVLYSAHDT